jgi:hypothetical protein
MRLPLIKGVRGIFCFHADWGGKGPLIVILTRMMRRSKQDFCITHFGVLSNLSIPDPVRRGGRGYNRFTPSGFSQKPKLNPLRQTGP